ncbi:zinc-binding dehydrogenase [Mucilaginibacter rubeus]|uniref:Zinc-binding dehydrogenase n=1 Tax=Mucilaginibacter rubeus TaxID=2027860 RepID=A0A5C1I4B2_9SPHI|nr:zinc-binding dehydrogenase [Mucilaginibacter rubeus]
MVGFTIGVVIKLCNLQCKCKPQIRIGKVFNLEDIAEACRLMDSNAANGKIVVLA